MKRKLAMLAILAVAGSALLAPATARAAAEEARNIDVYVLAGQSNAVGNSQLNQAVKGQDDATYTYRKALAAEDPRNSSGYEEILYYGAIEIHADAQFPDLSLKHVQLGQGLTSNHVGPELGMANELSKHYTASSPAAVFKCGVGGTYLGDWEGRANNTKTFGGWASPSLLAEWEADGKTVHPNAGKLYERLCDTVRTGLAKLRAENYVPQIKGFLWMQGESDTERQEWGMNYAHNLELFIEDLRKDIKEIANDENAAQRPFVIGKIAEDFANRVQPYIDQVRAAEDEVAETLPYVYTVNTDDLHIGGGNGSDDWHFNAGDVYELGKRFAATVFEHLAKYSYAVTAGTGGSVKDAVLLSDGEPVTVEYTVDRGKALDKVLLNGQDVTATALKDGVISFTPAADSPAYNTVKLVFRSLTKYKLSVNLGAGGKIASRSLSSSTVYEGETLVLTLTPDEGYEVDKVVANGTETTADGGKYSIPIVGDTTVDVTFRPTGAPSPEEPGEEDGCGGVIGGAAFGAIVLAGAALLIREKTR